MAIEPGHPVTGLLRRSDAGDEGAQVALWYVIYPQLRAMASRHMRKEAKGRTLQPTAVVHEAWMRLVAPPGGWESRKHFFGAMAKVMRDVVVDDARKRKRVKRGGDQCRRSGDVVALQIPAARRDPAEILAVHEAVERLRALNTRQAEVVVFRYFASMTTEETAEALGVSQRTVVMDSKLALAWLRRELERGDA